MLQVGEARVVDGANPMVGWFVEDPKQKSQHLSWFDTSQLGGEHQGCHIGNETREHILEDTFGRLINVLLALLQTRGC